MCIRDVECLVSIFVVVSLELCSSSCTLGWISSALAVIMNTSQYPAENLLLASRRLRC